MGASAASATQAREDDEDVVRIELGALSAPAAAEAPPPRPEGATFFRRGLRLSWASVRAGAEAGAEVPCARGTVSLFVLPRVWSTIENC